MIHPTLKQLKLILPTLTSEQYVRLVRVILSLRTQENLSEPLSAASQLTAYLYEWLIHLGFLQEDRIRWILDKVHPDLEKYAAWLEETFDDWPACRSRVWTLAVTDKRYAVWTDLPNWADLEFETFTPQLDRPPKTHIVCDLFGVIYEKQSWLKRVVAERSAT